MEPSVRGASSPRAQVVLITAARFFSSIIGIAVPLVIVRVLDPREFGYYKAMFLVAGTILPLVTLGIPASLYYLVPRHPGASQRLFRQSALFLIVAGAIATVLLIAFDSPLERALHAPFRAYAWPIAIFTGLSVPAGLLPIAPMVDGRARLTAALVAGTDVLRSALIVGVALVTRSLGAIVAVAALSVALQAAIALVYIGWRGRRQPDTTELGEISPLRAQLSYALPFAGSTLLGLSRDKLHAYFIAIAFSPVQFAVYAVAILNLPFIDQLTQTVSEVVILQTAASFGEGRVDDARRSWQGATMTLALVLAPVFVLAEIFAHEIIVVLFGARYASAAPIFRVYALTIALSILMAPAMFRAMKDLGAMIAADFSSLVVSIAIIAVLGRRVGPIAGALSLVGGVATFTVIGVWRLRARLGVKWRALLPWPSVIAPMVLAAVTGIPVHAALSGAPAVVTLLGGGAVAALAYAALTWRVGLVGPAERVIVTRWLDRVGLARLAIIWPAGRSWAGHAAVYGAEVSGSR